MARGEQEAFAALYDRYAAIMMGVGQRMLSDFHNAEDLVHDVFLEAWRRAEDYAASRGTVRTWLLMRLRSRAIDRLRSGAVKRTTSVDDATAAELVDHGAQDPAMEPDRAVVRRAMAALPEQQRVVLEAAYFNGMTATEIAEQEAIPVGTVKSRMAAALRKLRGGVSDEMWSE